MVHRAYDTLFLHLIAIRNKSEIEIRLLLKGNDTQISIILFIILFN